ncbi:MAG: flippase-like domain-containing protein [Ignavibacteriaceae bacterium]|nr:flippase-like domain-containing protein [Ignavibacteriaceae bacterium]
MLFLFMAFFKISLMDIWKSITSLKVWQLLLIICVYFLISGLTILTRKYLLYSLSAKAKLKNLVFVHFSTMAAHYSTQAKLGFPFAVYLLNRFENIPYAIGTAMILIELFVSTGICGIIAFIGSLFYFSHNTKTIIFALFILLIIIGLTFYFFLLFLRKKEKNGRVYQFVKDLHLALIQISINKSLIFTLMNIFIQVFSGINLVLLSYFFSADLSLWQAVVAGSTAFFFGAISMVPFGLGVREASMLFYLHHVGIPNEIGLSIITIQRLVSTGLSFVLGTIFGAILGVRNIGNLTT